MCSWDTDFHCFFMKVVLGCINVARYTRKASQYSAAQNDEVPPRIKLDTQ